MCCKCLEAISTRVDHCNVWQWAYFCSIFVLNNIVLFYSRSKLGSIQKLDMNWSSRSFLGVQGCHCAPIRSPIPFSVNGTLFILFFLNLGMLHFAKLTFSLKSSKFHPNCKQIISLEKNRKNTLKSISSGLYYQDGKRSHSEAVPSCAWHAPAPLLEQQGQVPVH